MCRAVTGNSILTIMHYCFLNTLNIGGEISTKPRQCLTEGNSKIYTGLGVEILAASLACQACLRKIQLLVVQPINRNASAAASAAGSIGIVAITLGLQLPSNQNHPIACMAPASVHYNSPAFLASEAIALAVTQPCIILHHK